MKSRVCVVLLSLITSTVWADCGSFKADNPLQELFKQTNCLGYEDDPAGISQHVYETLPNIDVSQLQLRSSADIAELRKKTAILLDNIAVSLDGVPRTDQFSPLFETFSEQLTKDRQSVIDGGIHPAELWNQDDLEILEGRVSIPDAIGRTCENDDRGRLVDEPSCKSGFRQARELLRHAKLVHVVLIESDQHIPALSKAYDKLNEQWNYYFGKARSQYPWELWINSLRYDNKLVNKCKQEKESTLTGNDLWEFCRKHKDIRLSAPPNDQLILLHPTAAMEIGPNDPGDVATNTIGIVEILGYFRFGSPKKFPTKWPVGGSIISTVALDSNGERYGWGALLHLKESLSIGVAKGFVGNSDIRFLITVDIGKFWLRKKTEVQNKFKFLDLK